MRFSVPISGYGLAEYPHAACFVDYVQALVAALRDLGHEVVAPTVNGSNVDPTARPIVFGAQKMRSVDDPRDKGSFCPPNAILYNSEQTGAAGVNPGKIFEAVSTWKNRVIWDYSKKNAETMRRMGCEKVIHCPVGYHSTMSRIAALPPEREDIDVLFYGSVASPAEITYAAQAGIRILDRGQILTDLRKAGLRVEHVFGIYGAALDPYVQRAKIVLNLHYYEGAIFEIFRCSQLFANKKCVVTEDGGTDVELEDLAKQACAYVSRANIVKTCKFAVENSLYRTDIAELGFLRFKKIRLVENVRKALENS